VRRTGQHRSGLIHQADAAPRIARIYRQNKHIAILQHPRTETKLSPGPPTPIHAPESLLRTDFHAAHAILLPNWYTAFPNLLIPLDIS
jgi:hypothetical protein